MSIKFGIIGPGNIARNFADALNTVDGVELYGVASRNIDRAEDFKKEYNATKAYASYDEMLDDEDINSVYVALPHNFHYDIAKKALQKGKNVICEKPMVLTLGDCEDLFATAKENNVLLMEAMWSLCLPVTRKVKQIIEDGVIGDVNHIQTSFCFNGLQGENPNLKSRLYNKDLAGGALYDVGIYTMAYPMGILGQVPVAFDGMCQVGETGVDFLSSIMMSFPNGEVASCTSSVDTVEPELAYVFGRKAHIKVDRFYGSKKLEVYNDDYELIDTFEDTKYENGFCYQVEHFRDLVLAGKKESDIVTPEITTACAKVMDTLIAKWGLK